MKIGLTLSDLARCPQCNVANPLLEFQNWFCERNTSQGSLRAWFCYRCSKCDDLVAAFTLAPQSIVGQPMPAWLLGNPLNALAVLPAPTVVDNDLPPKARRYLEQAIESLHAPDGAIMLAGSAIDAMLKAKGFADGGVYARINKAVEDHVLTEGMSEWAHAVRLEANKPRHADLDEPHATKLMAEQTVEFAQALGEFLFALPARIERGKVASSEASAARS